MLGFVLAESSPQNVCDVVNRVFSRFDALAHPQTLLTELQYLSIVWAVVFLIAGLVCLLNGYQVYKWVIVIAGICLGILAGYYLGQKIRAQEIVAASLGLLLGISCMPLMRWAVAGFGALAGAFLGANAWTSISLVASHGAAAENIARNYWIGALVGAVIFGMLAFILFKLSVVFFTTVSGSTLVVLGAIALLLQMIPAWRGPITQGVSAHAAILPVLVFVPALIGLIVQQSSKKPMPSEQKKPG
ncbi:MAG: hypothetical protein IT443_01125 [Phycisphaeraceae bacterium]|nr:hypothetical protein [Phycisphaeraceae bacterium]